MDAARFDRLIRSLAAKLSRRRFLPVLGFPIPLGVVAAYVPELATAKKRKKKLKFNAFGCVNVGGKCRGKNGHCCSGICKGSKPKRGEKDKSRCVAHDASDCQAGQRQAFCGGTNEGCLASSSLNGNCNTTTGNAGYCSLTEGCFACKKDVDCEPFCGAGAACLRCEASCGGSGGTACASFNLAGCDFTP